MQATHVLQRVQHQDHPSVCAVDSPDAVERRAAVGQRVDLDGHLVWLCTNSSNSLVATLCAHMVALLQINDRGSRRQSSRRSGSMSTICVCIKVHDSLIHCQKLYMHRPKEYLINTLTHAPMETH